MNRTIEEQIQGYRTKDGAGVSLVRVLANNTITTYDPILLLDSFDSTNPADYTAGFPLHPHRGIETISLIVKGNMVHKDSLGNSDAITSGEVQWMTAGSGILHEERLPASERMLGVQLWLNMPQKDKMAPPEYQSIKVDEIEDIPIEGGILRLVCGQYGDHQGHQSKYLPLDYYDIRLEPNQKLTLETPHDKSIMVFTLLGDAKIAGEVVAEKTAVKLTEGDSLEIESLEEDMILLFVCSNKLDEPVAWGGPIVMNSREELETAFAELRKGTFLKQEIDY
ncbi:pirin family protein [bacterium]|nr:pirin family protein [bacterium]